MSDEVASKFAGLDVSARMVYQVIEKAENMGIWVKDIAYQTSLPKQSLNKIYKILESRKLIKTVKVIFLFLALFLEEVFVVLLIFHQVFDIT